MAAIARVKGITHQREDSAAVMPHCPDTVRVEARPEDRVFLQGRGGTIIKSPRVRRWGIGVLGWVVTSRLEGECWMINRDFDIHGALT